VDKASTEAKIKGNDMTDLEARIHELEVHQIEAYTSLSTMIATLAAMLLELDIPERHRQELQHMIAMIQEAQDPKGE
jgi:hypothetical protein